MVLKTLIWHTKVQQCENTDANKQTMIHLPGNNRQPTLWQFGQWQDAKAWGLPALIASSGLPVDTYCLYLNFVSAAREGAETNLIKAWQAEQLCLKTTEICTCSKEIIIIMSFCLVLLNRRKKKSPLTSKNRLSELPQSQLSHRCKVQSNFVQ